jgi:hypothetical protein
VSGERATVATPNGGGTRRTLLTVVGALIVVVSLVGLGVQAVRGDRTVGAQRRSTAVRDASLDDAYYHCIDVQTRSLVSPGQPVVIAAADLQDFVTLLKGAGSWITFADPVGRAEAKLSLRNGVHASGACLGTVVVARYPAPGGGTTVRVGTGASVAGDGPPPPPPL